MFMIKEILKRKREAEERHLWSMFIEIKLVYHERVKNLIYH